MIIEMMKAKIHRATVTEANLNYVGSITIDVALMKAAGIIEYEKVQVVDINNGNRFETYAITGDEGSGMICLNGAAAREVSVGDRVIIMSYCGLDANEAKTHRPKVVFVNEDNSISSVEDKEVHGMISCASHL